MIMLSHLFILTKDSFLYDLKSKRLVVFLLLYLTVFGVMMYLFFQIQTSINQEFAAQGVSGFQRDLIEAFVQGVVMAQTGEVVLINFLMKIPFLNIALFCVALFGTPTLLAIMNYDKISQEIYDGSIRFKLYRTSRWTFYLSKFLSALGVCMVATLLAFLGSLLWAQVMVTGFDFGVSFWTGLRLWAIAQVFLSVFVALFVAVSSWVTRSFAALITCFVLYVGSGILPLFIRGISPYDGQYLRGLFYGDWSYLGGSMLVYVVMMAAFLGVGYIRFAKRDLS